jgi:hypothetical protein
MGASIPFAPQRTAMGIPRPFAGAESSLRPIERVLGGPIPTLENVDGHQRRPLQHILTHVSNVTDFSFGQPVELPSMKRKAAQTESPYSQRKCLIATARLWMELLLIPCRNQFSDQERIRQYC